MPWTADEWRAYRLRKDTEARTEAVEYGIARIPRSYMEYGETSLRFTPGKPFVVVLGEVGSHKTTQAVALLVKTARSRFIVPRFISYGRLVAQIVDSKRFEAEPIESVVQRVSDYRLLLVDDLGSDVTFQSAGGFERERTLSNICEIIEARGSRNRLTIFTSNLDLEQLASAMGPRIASRLDRHGALFTFEKSA